MSVVLIIAMTAFCGISALKNVLLLIKDIKAMKLRKNIIAILEKIEVPEDEETANEVK